MSMSWDPTTKAILRHLNQLAKDEAGSMTVYAIVFFVLLTAVGGLAIDLGRYYGVHGQMQAFVDDVALAAAAELDGDISLGGKPLCRALYAATGVIGVVLDPPLPTDDCTGITGTGLVAGTQNFAQNEGGSDTCVSASPFCVQQLRFFQALGPDTDPTKDVVLCNWTRGSSNIICAAPPGALPCPGLVENPCAKGELNSHFVEVVATQRKVDYVVLRVADALFSLAGVPSSSPSLQLRAAAGFKEEVCGATPILVCNPTENPILTPTFSTLVPGQQIRLTAPAGASWAPGEFGLIATGSAPSSVPSDAGGPCAGKTDQVLCMLGLVNPLTQCIANRVDTQAAPPDATVDASNKRDALNTRFDIYGGTMASHQGDPAFRPSANVTKGICKLSGSNCDYSGLTCSLSDPGWGLPSPPNWKGQWNATTTYTSGNIVSDSGQAYSAKALPGNMGQTPSTHPTYWSVLPASSWGSITTRLPRDRAFDTDAPSPGTHLGLETAGSTFLLADLNVYWAANHGGASRPGTVTSRYLAYRYEIDTPIIPRKLSPGENGDATVTHTSDTCSKQVGKPDSMSATTTDRRVLIAPMVNCLQYSVGWGTSLVPVLAYVELFLSEPVGLNAAGAPDLTKRDVYAEFVGTVKPGSDGRTVRDLAQLYR